MPANQIPFGPTGSGRSVPDEAFEQILARYGHSPRSRTSHPRRMLTMLIAGSGVLLALMIGGLLALGGAVEGFSVQAPPGWDEVTDDPARAGAVPQGATLEHAYVEPDGGQGGLIGSAVTPTITVLRRPADEASGLLDPGARQSEALAAGGTLDVAPTPTDFQGEEALLVQWSVPDGSFGVTHRELHVRRGERVYSISLVTPSQRFAIDLAGYEALLSSWSWAGEDDLGTEADVVR